MPAASSPPWSGSRSRSPASRRRRSRNQSSPRRGPRVRRRPLRKSAASGPPASSPRPSGSTCWRRSSGRRNGCRRAPARSHAPRRPWRRGGSTRPSADRSHRGREPRALGLDRLKDRLAQVREQEAQGRRAAETEQVLRQYLQRKQLPLARLAFETLLEVQPNHAKRGEYEGWIQVLAEESEKAKRAEAAYAAGRGSLERRDFQAARRELETIARNDATGKRAEAFNEELERTEREVRENVESEQRRRRFEELIAAHRVVEAKEELDALAKLDIPRVTLDFYREQLTAARAGIQKEEQDAVFARRYRQSVEDHNWSAAREIARELEAAQPSSPRATAMFSEVDRLESIHRRQQALEQGVHQVEAFIAQGDAAKAELALKILVQMDPENRHRKRLEKAVGGFGDSCRGGPVWPPCPESQGAHMGRPYMNGFLGPDRLPDHDRSFPGIHDSYGRLPRRAGAASPLCLHEAHPRPRFTVRVPAAHRPGLQVVQRGGERGHHHSGRPGAGRRRRPLHAPPRPRRHPRRLSRSRARLPGLRLRRPGRSAARSRRADAPPLLPAPRQGRRVLAGRRALVPLRLSGARAGHPPHRHDQPPGRHDPGGRRLRLRLQAGGAATGSPSTSSARGAPRPATSTRGSTWPPSGSCR